MALYHDGTVVKKDMSSTAYTKIWSIGDNPDHPGIYECQSCLYEDVINRSCTALPPCSNCKKPGHSNNWKLLVVAQSVGG